MARQLHRELNNRHIHQLLLVVLLNWIISRFWANYFFNWTVTIIYLYDYWDYFIRIYACFGRIVIK